MCKSNLLILQEEFNRSWKYLQKRTTNTKDPLSIGEVMQELGSLNMELDKMIKKEVIKNV